MTCPGFIHLINTAEAARDELRHAALAEAEVDPVLNFASSTRERLLRTTIFSAEIDAAYHRANCPQCNVSAVSDTDGIAGDQLLAA